MSHVFHKLVANFAHLLFVSRQVISWVYETFFLKAGKGHGQTPLGVTDKMFLFILFKQTL